jgi:hypothetical protein
VKFTEYETLLWQYLHEGRLCGLATDPEVPGSIPGGTRFSEK